MSRFVPVALVGLGLVLGCDSHVVSAPLSPGPPPPPLPVSVALGPDDATLVSGGKLQFQAISTSTVAGWEWSLSDAARGSISTEGVLVALQPGTVQVRACATNAPSICGAVMATVIAAPATGGAPAVTLTPETATVSTGQTVEFLVGANNFATPGWTWLSLDNATATIDASGLLTARRAGVAVVVACAASTPHFCASARVRVQ